MGSQSTIPLHPDSTAAKTEDPVVATPAAIDSNARNLSWFSRRVLTSVLAANVGALEFILPNARRLRFGNAAHTALSDPTRNPDSESSPAVCHVHRDRFFRRVALFSDVGLARAFMDGDWSTPDLTKLMHYFCVNIDAIRNSPQGSPLLHHAMQMFQFFHRNSPAQARRNIYKHYDLGNAFFEAWLDKSMTYSSARFVRKAPTLFQAQQEKYASICRDLNVRDGDHILEIGCGWGGFCEFAAKYRNCKITALTISPSQWSFAKKRVFEAGLGDRVDIALRDYRDEHGRYDNIASIEMLEAVGEEFWGAYFETLRRCLRNGGRAGIQVITIRDDLFAAYRNSLDALRRYIFPGGLLPTHAHLHAHGEAHGLPLISDRSFGEDYARTLRLWHRRFQNRWREIRHLGFDERFSRLWRFYLSTCEAGFLSGRINVRQLLFERT